jgi:hypothetical protein
MTAPIDLPCPVCKSTSGNYCTELDGPGGVRERVTFHHADRIDAAARETDRARYGNPDRLRAALRRAIDRWRVGDPEMVDAWERNAICAEFDL